MIVYSNNMPKLSAISKQSENDDVLSLHKS
jgi:hypothetical protein